MQSLEVSKRYWAAQSCIAVRANFLLVGVEAWTRSESQRRL